MKFFEVQSLLHTIYKPSSLTPGQYKDFYLFMAEELPTKGKFQAEMDL